MMVLSAFVVLSVSCNNEEEIGGNEEPGEDVLHTADSLANAFAGQVAAMRTLSGETETGVSYAVLREAGDALVALTDETSFVSCPDGVEYYPVLACHIEAGLAYWALLDKDGNAEPLKDGSDALIPMTADVSLKLTKDGYALTVAGKEFDTVFAETDRIQAFACDFHMDAESKIYAVTVVFGAEAEKTLPSLNYNRVGFLPPYDPESEYVSEYFVNHASTSSVVLEIPEGIAYTLEVTEGWKAEDRKADGVTYVDLTAPAASNDGGESLLKVVSDECGVVLSELVLVNAPFRAMFTSASDVFVEPSVGVRKYVYGVSDSETYSEEAVLAIAEGLVAGTADAPAGCAMAEEAVKASLAELLGGDVNPDKRYVLWAVPALYREGENAGYYVAAGTVCDFEFGAMVFDLTVVEAKVLDAEIAVKARGVEAVYGGVVPKTDDAMELVASRLRNSYYSPIAAVDGGFEFTGFLTDYPAAGGTKNEILPASTYMVWVAPAFEGEYPYEVEDISFVEVTTLQVVAGGAIEAAFGTVETQRSSLSVPVSAEGAAMMYYAVFSNSDGKIYKPGNVDNAIIFEEILKRSPVAARGASVVAEANGLKPNTTYWIFAVAVDEDGKYGPVTCVSGKTKALVYDSSIRLSVDMVTKTATEIQFKVTSEGGDLSDYIYWAGRTTDPFWANSTYCGGSRNTGQQYMALNPDNENIVRAMNKYGELASDGTILIDELTMKTSYTFIILEKGDENYSAAASMTVETLEANLGDIVREGTDKWKEALAKIQIKWHEEKFEQVPLLTAYYAFDISCPKDLTAYILCAGESYYEDMGFTMKEQFMIDIEQYTSRRLDKDHVPYKDGVAMCEPDYYQNGTLVEGQLLSVNDFYVHGSALFGAVTYFAEGVHETGGCSAWKNGVCENYQRALERIAYYNTLAPFESRAASFGLKGEDAVNYAKGMLEATSFYYKDAVPIIYINDGSPLYVVNASAMGVNEDGVVPDRVYVMFKDLQGNYYEPMSMEVPNYFDRE